MIVARRGRAHSVLSARQSTQSNHHPDRDSSSCRKHARARAHARTHAHNTHNTLFLFFLSLFFLAPKRKRAPADPRTCTHSPRRPSPDTPTSTAAKTIAPAPRSRRLADRASSNKTLLARAILAAPSRSHNSFPDTQSFHL